MSYVGSGRPTSKASSISIRTAARFAWVFFQSNTKRSGRAELVKALNAAASGGAYVDPHLAHALIDLALSESDVEHMDLDEDSIRLLRLLASGVGNRAIGETTGWSDSNLRTTRRGGSSSHAPPIDRLIRPHPPPVRSNVTRGLADTEFVVGQLLQEFLMSDEPPEWVPGYFDIGLCAVLPCT